MLSSQIYIYIKKSQQQPLEIYSSGVPIHEPETKRAQMLCELPEYYYALQAHRSYLSDQMQPLSILFLLGGMPNQMCPGNHKHLAIPLAITEEAITKGNSQN